MWIIAKGRIENGNAKYVFFVTSKRSHGKR